MDEEAVETASAISSLRSGKDLPNPYKDHPLHKSSIDEETPIVVVEQDSSSEDEEERVDRILIAETQEIQWPTISLSFPIYTLRVFGEELVIVI